MNISTNRAAFAILVVLLLAGCTHFAASPTIPPPSGIHLLTDATVQFKAPDTATFQVNIFSGGTQTCEDVWVRMKWPDKLKEIVKQEGTTLEGLPLPPNARGRFTGETTFDVSSITTAQLQTYIRDASVTIQCTQPSGYERQVIPTYNP